ncbi:FAD/NAD(P)-binding protein [Glarea lozoyensis ATCC 20868]|uniref:FAD/NAD(P)-binding protein n=1 Tax=Glarea lozoyensis (strain ATCC 20868 / MF5171) TaxID=1116229 RepID=S3DC62_GLAL2|nr:FAD/NAD(P)-binding protein [Glarea lozoyensis ATCC 20868]EPE24253.1 FAD/NAD(P)-binding protein [Glarea lozoyensis ATCC 20868]
MADFLVPKDVSPDLQGPRRLDGPIHAERHVNIICVGAGASGLLMTYKLQKHFSNFSLTVFEKNPEVSGTWFENRYPGCACDVPSHNYTWSFEPKLDWTGVYSSSKEIFQYFDSFANKYGLKNYIKTEHQVTGAYWNDRTGGYDVKVRDTKNGQQFSQHCDILINASGILNNWRWPAIPGLQKYKGTLLHTANWDDNVDLTGKHVGLIGNGSSGIQVLPKIQPIVDKVTTFIREPTWVSPVQGLEQHVYSAEEQKDFAQKPGVLTEYRKNIERGLNGQFGIFLKDTKPNNDTHDYMMDQMHQKLQNQYLEERLIPKWSVGCRRLTPGVGYLESLGKENVKTVYGEINEITEKGCLCDDGNEYPVDILICATGFDTTFKPRFPLIGPGGVNLQEQWKDDPHSYLGMAADGFPNYLIFLGPNSPIGNGPVLCAIEAQADYMLKLIDRYQTRNIKTFAPTKSAINDFIAHKDEFMKKSVWADPCRSWYKQGPDGPITALWPGSALHYIEAIREVQIEDWDIKYSGNRFAWMGNGYSQTELDNTADWGYYIRDRDDDPPATTGGKRKVLSKSGTMKGNAGINFAGVKDEAPVPERANL